MSVWNFNPKSDIVDYLLPKSFYLVLHITTTIQIATYLSGSLSQSPMLTSYPHSFLYILPGALNLTLVHDLAPLSEIILLMQLFRDLSFAFTVI